MGTLSINVLASLLMGVAVEYFAFRSGLSQHFCLLVTTGILGGFTTLSTFSLETASLYERGEAIAIFAYVLASVIVSIGALFAAMGVFRILISRSN
ncbi:CrcB protein [Rhodoligotrophos appendicifer]|uniref:CrcB family protein n=1 Tax=Rhodoligotrophos appendicifer TaxID=987056 RepID=UPI00319E6415